jgi:membrane-associated phospholipid phosphatase
MPPRSDASCTDRRPGPRATALGLAGFAALLAAGVAWKGLFLSRDWIFAWVLAALLALSLGDLRRGLSRAARDWLPLMAVLLLYDLSSPVREALGIAPHVLPQLEADRLLPGAQVPTVALQDALYSPGVARWYDYATLGVYLTHFFATLAVAVAVWRFAPERFARFRALVVALATAGFATYVLFPAVPPWMAGEDGFIPPVHRIVGEMWTHVGVSPAAALFETRDAFYNDVAALPSLHAAYPVLLLLFFWGAGARVRAGLGAYALAMAFTLVYMGEHYVSDVVVGWLYAGGVHAALSAVAARREASRSSPRLGGYEPAPTPAPEPARAAP